MELPYLEALSARLPHAPIWNLIPRRKQTAPWECSWHGKVTGTACAECRREHAEYVAAGTWADRRCLDWTVSVGGYRLVIEHGAIIGLAYDEDPWPWGDPRWLTSHLIADHELRRITMARHACDENCVCPRHETPMIYWPHGDDHACPDITCPYGHGVRVLIGAGLTTGTA